MTTYIEQLECWVMRAPIAEPVANAFGAMTNRPAVFLRITASDGAFGWGDADEEEGHHGGVEKEVRHGPIQGVVSP